MKKTLKELLLSLIMFSCFTLSTAIAKDVVVDAKYDKDSNILSTPIYFSNLSYNEKVEYLESLDLNLGWLYKHYSIKQLEEFGLEYYKNPNKEPIPVKDRLKISEKDAVIGMGHGYDKYGRFMTTLFYFSNLSYNEKIQYMENTFVGKEWLEEHYTREEIKSFGLEKY